MAHYSKAEKIPSGPYQNKCVNGKCSGCGDCCTDMLPLTDKELAAIKRYAKAHNLVEHRQAPFWDRNAADLTCPFRNQQTRSCDIYPVRPMICRSFICSKPTDQAYAERDAIHKNRQCRSLRYEVFGNIEGMAFILGNQLRGMGLL